LIATSELVVICDTANQRLMSSDYVFIFSVLCRLIVCDVISLLPVKLCRSLLEQNKLWHHPWAELHWIHISLCIVV